MEGQELLGQVGNVVAVFQLIRGRSIIVEVVQVVESVERVVVTGGVGGRSIRYRGRLGAGGNVVEFTDVKVADFACVFTTLQHHIPLVVISNTHGDISSCSALSPSIALYTNK